jgi:uncharacterized protein YbjT (DUF2867 family)
MILVTGASGNVGRELVAALTAGGQPVRALTRSAKAAGLPPGAEAASGDLNDPASLRPALDGADGVFLLPGYSDMPGVLAAAGQAGVTRVVQLSGMSARTAGTGNAITAYMVSSEQAARQSGLA